MDIRYYQKSGRVGARYRLSSEELDRVLNEDLIRFFPAEDPWHKEIDIGLVPEEVQANGKQEIQKYALQACQDLHKENLVKHRKIRDEYYDRIRNVNRTISIHHNGKTLEGRIIKNPLGRVAVFLEKPFEPKEGYIIPDRRYTPLFTHEGYLNENIIEEAEKILIQLFEQAANRRKHGNVVNLVEALNGKNGDE